MSPPWSSSPSASSIVTPALPPPPPAPKTARPRVPSYFECIFVSVVKDGQEESFVIHQELLTARSLYFNQALRRESLSRMVELPNEDPEIFRYYVHLLYTGKVEVSLDCLSPNTYGHKEHCNIARLYVLAEKLQDVASKNAIISAMLAAFENKDNNQGIPGGSIIKIVWDGTPSGSKMHKLIVDMWADRATGSWIKKYKNKEWPADFLVDMTMALMEKRAPPNDLGVARDAGMYWEEEV